MTKLTPYLTVDDAAEAIRFYKRAFGAQEPSARILHEDGRIGHASLQFGEFSVYLADAFPEMDILSAAALGNSPVRLVLNVEDVDAAFSTALEAGATSLMAPEDQFYGERSGRLKDPFGLIWILSTTLEEEMTAEGVARGTGGQFKLADPE